VLFHGAFWKIAARELRAFGPRRSHSRKERREPCERPLRQAAIGRDLAPEHRQERRAPAIHIEVQPIIPRHVGGIRFAVVVERPHSTVAPFNVGRCDLAVKKTIRGTAEVCDFLAGDSAAPRIAVQADVSGPDEGIRVFVRAREHDPPVVVLQDIGVVALEETLDDDVAALHQFEPC
jgi:hypothetical protein